MGWRWCLDNTIVPALGSLFPQRRKLFFLPFLDVTPGEIQRRMENALRRPTIRAFAGYRGGNLCNWRVIFELGARWGSDKPMVPLLAPDFAPELLEGPLTGINALSSRTAAGLHELLDGISKSLGAPLESAASYQGHIDEIVNLANRSTAIRANELSHVVRRRSVAEIAVGFLRDPIKFISLLGLLSIGTFWLVQLIYRYAPSELSTSPQSSAEPFEQGLQEIEPSPITFRDFVDFFYKGRNTELQKDEFLKRHLNRRVAWEGWVRSVSDLNNQEISVRLLASEGGSESETAFLSFPQDDRPKLAALGVGQKITVSCKLRDFDSQAFLTACELTKVEPHNFKFSDTLPPFPEKLDTIRPGMRLSEARIVFPVGRLHAVAYSVELKHWPFDRVVYFLENGKEDPKIESVSFFFLDEVARKNFTAVAIKEFGAASRSETLGQRLVWSKLNGFVIAIDDNGYTISPQPE